MKKSILLVIVMILSVMLSCGDGSKLTNARYKTTTISLSELDSVIVLDVDSNACRFDFLSNAAMMCVYKDSLLIVRNNDIGYGDPLITIYDITDKGKRLADYFPYGSDKGEMIACGFQIIGDELFVLDNFGTRQYCIIKLNEPLSSAEELEIISTGIEEHGAAIIPFRKGLLVENPQCYENKEAGILNDVPRLLYYEQGKCMTPQNSVAYQVQDINTGADIHNNLARHRVCFVSHHQPFVEFYDDSLRLIHRLDFPSDVNQEIRIYEPVTTIHRKRGHGEKGRETKATFDKTQRVVGAGSQLHSFLCSAADEDYIYLVYCGKLFNHDYHAFPTLIFVMNWDGQVIDTYSYDRWVHYISPSSEKGVFYLTVYANDDSEDASTRLVKVYSIKK